MDPVKERHRRLMRDKAQLAMAEAIWAVLEGVEAPPFELNEAQRTWLSRLLIRPCRAHKALDTELCPGFPDCSGTIEEPAIECEHACPGPPLCLGSVGRMVACERSRVFEERNCERFDGERRALAKPISCNVAGCPHDEPRRQARHRLRYEAAVAEFDPRDIVLGVLTEENPERGELAAGLRLNSKDLSRLRRTPLFTGRAPCVARTSDGGPFHPCWHRDHAWRCRLELCADQPRWRNRGRLRRARRRCALLARHGRPCDHPACRPNCPIYRHRGVAGLAFFVESPASRSRGWNLHTNFLVALRARCDEHPAGCLEPRGCASARHFGWLGDWRELSWYWRRATCRRHRRCPGRPSCDGGAWDVHLEGYDPKKGIGEYVKYVTKPLELLEVGGPAALVEFLLARRRQKFVVCAGAFYGRRFQVDPIEQRKADAEMVTLWVSDFRKAKFPRRCPFGDHDADWDTSARHVLKVELEQIRGVLAYRPP